MILVTGATGNVGAELVRTLAAAGEPVRALVRDPSRATSLPDGVEPVAGDLNRPETLEPAIEEVRGVHLLAGYSGLPDALDRMRRAGVERVTLQSSSAVPGGDTTNAVARYHIESEAAIRASGLAWTFLQPNGFMSNALEGAQPLRHGDVLSGPFAGVRSRPPRPRWPASVPRRSPPSTSPPWRRSRSRPAASTAAACASAARRRCSRPTASRSWDRCSAATCASSLGPTTTRARR